MVTSAGLAGGDERTNHLLEALRSGVAALEAVKLAEEDEPQRATLTHDLRHLLGALSFLAGADDWQRLGLYPLGNPEPRAVPSGPSVSLASLLGEEVQASTGFDRGIAPRWFEHFDGTTAETMTRVVNMLRFSAAELHAMGSGERVDRATFDAWLSG